MKPILFNTEMVKAILDGRKTATRRLVKPQPKGAHTIMDCDVENHTFEIMCGNGGEGGIFMDWSETVKAPYWTGDILYVRETWQYAYDLDGNDQIIEETGRYVYAADGYNTGVNPDGTHKDHMPWRPSIHMPKEAARIFLCVTDVRVEQLQDITPDECVEEGVSNGFMNFYEMRDYPTAFGNEIWNGTIKPKDRALYGWDANPWVWVIEFERISKEEAYDN